MMFDLVRNVKLILKSLCLFIYKFVIKSSVISIYLLGFMSDKLNRELLNILFNVYTFIAESHVEYLVSKSQPDLFTVIHTLGNLNKFRYRRQAVSESETDKLSGQTGTSADVTSMPTPSVTSLTTSRIIVTSAEKSSTNSTVTLKSVATTPAGGVSVHPPTTFSTSTPATTKRVSTVTSTTKPVTDDSSPVIQQASLYRYLCV